uniref:non-specific serine/threonine protein kinase n=1 Tax=Cuerna arida TaxID=1464854 RepID=A0A1B6G4C9_9HEMI
MVKPTFNTYSKKKTKSMKPKVDYHFHVHVNNYVTNNIFLGTSDTSEDEFDKLLKGTSCQQGSSHTPVSRSTNIIKKQQFWPRQETVSFYNSDATTVSSSLSSAHLFKDTFGDSSEIYSLSRIPTPPSYNKDKKKCIKISIQKAKRNRIVKKKVMKVIKAPPRALVEVSPVKQISTAISSTPSHPFLEGNQWMEAHVSPILATSPMIETKCRYSTDMFGDEPQQESECKGKSRQSLGLTALVEGLGKLELVTPRARTKRKTGILGGCKKDSSFVTPLRSERRQEKTDLLMCYKTKTLNNTKEFMEEEAQELSLNTEKVSKSTEKEFQDQNLNQLLPMRVSSKSCSNNALLSSRKQTKSKLTITTPIKQDSEDSFCRGNKLFSGDSPNKKSKDELHELVCNRNQQMRVSSDKLVCEASVVISSINHSEIKDPTSPVNVKETYDLSQSSHNLKIEDRLHCPKVPSIPSEKLLNTGNKKEEVAICNTEDSIKTATAGLRKVPLSYSELSSFEQNKVAPSEETCFKKPNLSLLPGKAWRRSLLQQKQSSADLKRCTIGPALMAKLIRDAAPTLNSSVVNSTKSIMGNKEREDVNKINNTTTFEMSSNLSIFNNSDLFKRVSIRSKRQQEKSNFFGRGYLSSNCDFAIHGIPEESRALEEVSINKVGNISTILELEKSLEDGNCKNNEGSDDSLDRAHCSDISEIKLIEEELGFEGSESFALSEHGMSEPSGLIAKCDSGELHLNSTNTSQINSSQTSYSKHSSDDSPNDQYIDNVNNSAMPVNESEQNSIFETPPILRNNPGVLSTITKRRKNFYLENSMRFLDLSEGSLHSDEEHLEEELACGLEDLPVVPSFAVVLAHCGVQSPLSFLEAFPDRLVAGGKKIGEGVFGEVFLINRSPTEQSVIKIIPVEGSKLVNGTSQKLFEEVLPELIISEELSSLRTNPESSTNGFCELKNKFVLQGEYPKTFKDMWCEYDRLKRSENDNVDMFESDQLYIALELEHAGAPLESCRLPSAKQAYFVFLQVVFTLAVAESVLEFEHRDLHYGNILIKKTQEDYMNFLHHGISCKVPTLGYKATIIDFTLSRITYKDEVVFLDLETDPELFEGQNDYQFDIYRFMRKDLDSNWSLHAPITNIRWLHYLADKMVTKVKYNNKVTKLHKQFIKNLNTLKDLLEDFSSASDLAEFFSQTYQETMHFIEVD